MPKLEFEIKNLLDRIKTKTSSIKTTLQKQKTDIAPEAFSAIVETIGATFLGSPIDIQPVTVD